MNPKSPASILTEADAIINGPRRDSYGNATESFTRVAAVWSAILRAPVTPRQVAQCMIALKVLRDANKPSHDNLLDVIGYAALADYL